MKVARATHQDLDAAMMLMGLLDTVSSGYYPSDTDDEDDGPLFFDADDPEHLAQLWKRLSACFDAAPGFQGRVIFGLATLMDPRNEVIDQDDDCLSLHPKLMAAMKNAERYQALRRGQKWSVIDGIGGTLRAEALDAAIDATMPEEIDEAMAMPANAELTGAAPRTGVDAMTIETPQTTATPTGAASVLDDGLEGFEAWWVEHGQYCRAGGGDYEKTFAFRAWQAATTVERERICTAIKTEDDHCADGDYMLDSDDCIAVAQGKWQRPDWNCGQPSNSN